MTTTVPAATPPQSAFDTDRAEAFAGRLVTIVDDACAALMTSIGQQTGLFDTLATLPPATSEEIARAAGLHERYVREWLAAMTMARFVEHDPDALTFSLPAEHAAWLTTAAGPDNLGRITTFLPMLAEVEQGIVRCFREGGGLPYSAYPRFHATMAADSAAVLDVALLDLVVPLVPGLPERLAAGIDVADVGCGQGHAINLLARAFPASRFTGFDFSGEAIAAARAEAVALGLTNAEFVVRDVAEPGSAASYDLVTAYDAIHDQAHPATVLANIHRELRPGGTFLMVDIKASSVLAENLDQPFSTFLYTASTMHCMTVSLGLDGDGLGTAWGRQLAEQMLVAAGFGSMTVHEIETDPVNAYYVATA